MNFKQAFFKIYDEKIASGQITFSQSGIGKEDFTRLCTEPDFVLDTETLERLMVTMKLTEEERLLLKQTAKVERI
ncbi:hypothetical protein ACPW7J_10470 [Ihubacter sp. rT4E-8]|uniref:hypothetical protein n=1 Tax=unclassified Ihubacter TaxID=2633299 RepID=UPI003C7B98DB